MATQEEGQDSVRIRSLVRSHLLALQARRFGWLAFADTLEMIFESRTAATRSRRLYVEGWFMILVYCFAILGHRNAQQNGSDKALLLRCFVALPLMCLGNEVLRHKTGNFVREGSVVLTTSLVTITELYLCSHINPVVSAVAVISLVISTIVTSVVMRIRFPFAIIANCLTVVAAGIFLIHDHLLVPTEKANTLVPLVIASIFTLAASHSLERQERLSFLLQLGNELQQEELQSLNVQLERLSSEDSLTGLANRAAFDQRLKRSWEEATAGRMPFSLILIDIDHFKRVNDTQGHLYGDEVLKRVAVLTRESLRGTGDFAARYGGEEFVILLPNTLPVTAHTVAERIRSLVQLAGSPSGSDPDYPMWTTISCGVAGVESTTGHSGRELLRDADRALYRAKAAGRNKVCMAQEEAYAHSPALTYQPA